MGQAQKKEIVQSERVPVQFVPKKIENTFCQKSDKIYSNSRLNNRNENVTGFTTEPIKVDPRKIEVIRHNTLPVEFKTQVNKDLAHKNGNIKRSTTRPKIFEFKFDKGSDTIAKPRVVFSHSFEPRIDTIKTSIGNLKPDSNKIGDLLTVF
jgi:hypothetical protein